MLEWLTQNWFLLLLLAPAWPTWDWLRSPKPWGTYVSHLEAHNQAFLRVAHPRRWPLPPRQFEYLYRKETEGAYAHWIKFPTGEVLTDDGEDCESYGALLTGMLEFARARDMQANMIALRELEAQNRREAAGVQPIPGYGHAAGWEPPKEARESR